MQSGQPSRTAQGAAFYRVAHQRLPAPTRILDDPVAAKLVDLNGEAYQRWVAFHADLPEATLLRLTNFVMRSRFTEDCLADSVEAGIRQYVILGAGLDTFAYRQPEWASSLRIVEVDHPATQEMKLDRLRGANIEIPGNLTFAPVDFGNVTLAEALLASGLDFARPSFFCMLGVSMYLAPEALDETLKLVLSMPGSSQIVFSFVVPDHMLSPDDASYVTPLTAFCAEIGEPWLYRPTPAELLEKLASLGFSQARHLSPEDANNRYFAERDDGLNAAGFEQMVHAIV